jgi:hypothetical protein
MNNYLHIYKRGNSLMFKNTIPMQQTKEQLFMTVPESSINSCMSWFIFNLRKINNNQYRVLVSLIQGWWYDM